MEVHRGEWGLDCVKVIIMINAVCNCRVGKSNCRTSHMGGIFKCVYRVYIQVV